MNLVNEDAAGLELARKLKVCVQPDPQGVISMQNRILTELHAGHRASSRKRLVLVAALAVFAAASFAALRTVVAGLADAAAKTDGSDGGQEAAVESSEVPRTLGVSLQENAEPKMVLKQAITSLSDAVANAASGDTIELDEGTYKLTDTISIANKSLTLKGAPGTARERVIVDGDGANTHRRCFYVNNTKDYAVRFEGLTIRNGYECGESGAGDYYGGGIWAKGPLTVSNCVFSCCVVSNGVVKEAAIGGGGLYVAPLNAVDVLIADSLFCSNEVAYVTTTAPDRGKGASAYGSGFYIDGASVDRYRVENCVISNCLGRASWSRIDSQFTRGTPGCSGGYASLATVSGCRFLDNGYEGDANTSFAGTLGLYAAVVTNSYFSGNRACNGGAIVGLSKSASYVRDCTITNNTASRGGAVAVPTTFAIDIRDTLVAGNFGGGAIALFGTGSVVSNCVIRGNVAGSKVNAGGILFSPMETAVCKSNVVVRSVIADNLSGGSGAGIMLGDYTTGNQVLDSIIAGNTYTGGNGIGIAYVVNGNNAKENVLRNSLLTGNTQYSGGSMPIVAFRCNTAAATLGTFSVSVENCTFAGNDLKSATSVLDDPAGKMPNGYDAVRLYNNIFAANVRTKTKAYPNDPYGIASVFMVANNQIKANLVDTDNWNENTRADNFAGNPLFENAAAGDFRLRRKSPACDCAVADPTWATKKAKDLGDGTYTMRTHADDSSVPEYGIRLVFNNVQKRLSGKGLDLGCFERPAEQGFTLIIR